MASEPHPAGRADLTRETVDQVIALRESGRLSEALGAVRALLQDHPKAQLLHNIMGTICAELDEPDQALECYRKALKLQPSYAAAHNNMGYLFKTMGRFDEAIEAYHRALKHLPDYVEAHVNLALALIETGKIEEAAARCRKALEISPNSAHAHAGLANALKELGHHDDAIVSFETALKFRPGHAETLSNLGLTRYELGEIEAAKQDFSRALAADPCHVHAHYNLARVSKYAQGDPHISQMKAVLEDLSARSKDRTLLNYALAKALEDSGQIDQAFQYLTEANRLRKAGLTYSAEQEMALFAQIKAVFASGKIEPVQPKPDAEGAKQPIFIVGMPRSGTTLVEQIIASHSEVYGAGELGILNAVLLPQFAKLAPGKTLAVNNYKLKSIGRSYEKGLKKFNVPEAFVTDKLPMNFMWIGFIRSALPNAKIVHVTRDPIATCWSIYKHYFAVAGLGFAYDQHDVAEFYKRYHDLMGFWRERFADGVYELSYEHLTENQEAETRKLIEWCGLAWEDQCLDFHKTPRAVSTASSLQVREAMYQGSSQSWTKFAAHLGPLKESLAL
ncbi:MAG: tetratricopeptide repeat protein [Alphaproteobacteria bacterium]|nr:tetratricopeptide repeat protein [Alphaproteobacteria bacterium]